MYFLQVERQLNKCAMEEISGATVPLKKMVVIPSNLDQMSTCLASSKRFIFLI